MLLVRLDQRFTFLAWADFSQETPRINAELVAIIPVKFDGVLAHSLSREGPRCFLKDGQRTRRELRRVTRITAGFAALIITQSTGAGVPQERKWIVRTMTIFPLDVHSGAGGQIDSYRLGIRQ